MSAKTWVSRIIGCAALVAFMATSTHAGEISGAGATFPYPIYAKWAESYKAATGDSLNYQSIGSGGGIKQIKQGTVTFGASDKPLEATELQSSGLAQFPMIIGGVVPVLNLNGVAPGALTLDGPTLASIYLGEIKSWNDPRIRQLNPHVALPQLAIAPVYRSDGSGTNFLFTNYLSKVSPTFMSKIGANTSVDWPVGIGAKGNEGVANMTTQTAGAIGYVEYAYAKQNKMSYALMKNHDGKSVSPEIRSFQAAAANADWSKAEGFYMILTDQPGPASWPITGASFILMHRENAEAGPAQTALKFFHWAYSKGGSMAQELDYVPLPDKVVSLVEDSWHRQITSKGQALWPAH